MKIAINQAYLFPYIGYFQLIESVDKIVLYENVDFNRKSYMNRNQLLNFSTGAIYQFNIPIIKSKKIYDVNIDTSRIEDWVKLFFKRIKHNYSRANFYEETIHMLDHAIDLNRKSLHSFNCNSLRVVSSHLKIQTAIEYDNRKYLPLEEELNLNKSKEDRMAQRVVAICLDKNADTYINLPRGKTLYKPSLFFDRGLKIQFLKLPQIHYKQFNFNFTPNLSIIDVLMHLGKEETKKLIENYEITY